MIGSDYFLLTSKSGNWEDSSMHSDSMYKNRTESSTFKKNQKLSYFDYCPCC